MSVWRIKAVRRVVVEIAIGRLNRERINSGLQVRPGPGRLGQIEQVVERLVIKICGVVGFGHADHSLQDIMVEEIVVGHVECRHRTYHWLFEKNFNGPGSSLLNIGGSLASAACPAQELGRGEMGLKTGRSDTRQTSLPHVCGAREDGATIYAARPTSMSRRSALASSMRLANRLASCSSRTVFDSVNDEPSMKTAAIVR
jgi:hypothetical protein